MGSEYIQSSQKKRYQSHREEKGIDGKRRASETGRLRYDISKENVGLGIHSSRALAKAISC
jgi:hypothetical protein